MYKEFFTILDDLKLDKNADNIYLEYEKAKKELIKGKMIDHRLYDLIIKYVCKYLVI